MNSGRVASALMVGFSLAGCSVKQLQDNTIDVGSSVGSIYTSQVLENLNSLANNPNAMPSFFSVSKGIIKTSNSITPSVTIPLGNQVTRSAVAAGGVTQIVGPYNSLGVQAAEAWEQTWEISPEKDPDELRKLRVVYLFALQKESQATQALDDLSASDQAEVKTIITKLGKKCSPSPGCFQVWPKAPCAQGTDGVSATGGWVCLGKYGSAYDRLVQQREMLISRTGYEKGILFDLVHFSLQLQSEVEAKATKTHGTSGNPAPPGHPSPPQPS